MTTFPSLNTKGVILANQWLGKPGTFWSNAPGPLIQCKGNAAQQIVIVHF